jgi:Peptidase_C39 like family
VLPVPRYSQMVHKGSYRQYGGGGEAWCSPTSTAMVLAYYDALPPESSYSWVREGHPDPEVAQVARATYDTSYGGTGTWPFNTAYAASRTGSAFVTRLRNLREVERFVNVGIPVVASIRFGTGELRGAPISSSNGHLLVIAGFTRGGDVVVNDPAAASRAGVRRTYDRTQFESAWLRRDASGSGGSGGIVYVIHDEEHPLPENMVQSNW